MCRTLAPHTQDLPIPRATTAACEVIPPRAVRMAWAATMPWKSSGLVSWRTSTTFSPSRASSSASSGSKTTFPCAAPELAELFGRDAANGRRPVDQPLVRHVHGDADGGRARELARASLEYEALAP